MRELFKVAASGLQNRTKHNDKDHCMQGGKKFFVTDA